MYESPSSTDETESAYNKFSWFYSKWIHCNILIAICVLTLITIVLFGDDEPGLDTRTMKIYIDKPNSRINCNGDAALKTSNKRGTGVVMGAHAIPLLYTSINIFITKSKCIRGSDSTCSADENSYATTHVKLASYAGFSFAASHLYTKWHQRKLFYSGRLQTKFHSMMNENKMTMTHMQLTSTIYLMLLMTDLIVSKLLQQSHQHLISMTLMALVQIFLISNYPSRSKFSWQNAFTPGEWMAVSTFITSLLAEFILQHILGIKTIDLPEHIIVSHAGLSGCILGVMACSLLQRKMKGQDTGMLASLLVVVATTLGCLEVAIFEETQASARDTIIPTIFDVPMSFRWLVNFLIAELNDGKFDRRTMPSRIVILLYWIAVLAVSLQVSIHIASWTTKVNHQLLQRPAQKRRVVIARKFFHGVAVLLFAPITWLDHDMMCLSYAIALSLMIMIEMLRCASIQEESAVDNKTKLTGGSSARILSVNTFYNVFFDEKDSSGGVVVSHISLIAGCACSLWVYQLLQNHHQLDTNSIDWPFLSLLPSIGVIVLGIGDSAGAIGGLSLQRPTRWPGGSSRTVEGSLCMFLSVMCAFMFFALCAGLDLSQSAAHIIFLLLVLTLVEASTKQIDNLCLPISASTLLILIAVLQRF